MDVSHIFVGALTAAAFAWLVWAEIRSRRNSADGGDDPLEGALAEGNPGSREAHAKSDENQSANIGSPHVSRVRRADVRSTSSRTDKRPQLQVKV